jgi:hypothetical protein
MPATSLSVSATAGTALTSLRLRPASFNSCSSKRWAPAPLLSQHKARLLPDEVGEFMNPERVSAPDDKALFPPGPLDQNEIRESQPFGRRRVVALPIRIGQVKADRNGLAGGEAFEPRFAPLEQRREPATRFAQRPFEQRVARSGDNRRRHQQPLVLKLGVRLHPAIHQPLREDQLARDARARDLPARNELIDRALLEPEIVGHFGSRQVVASASICLHIAAPVTEFAVA